MDNLANDVVAGIGDEQMSQRGQGNTTRVVELNGIAGVLVRGQALCSVARNAFDRSCCIDLRQIDWNEFIFWNQFDFVICVAEEEEGKKESTYVVYLSNKMVVSVGDE